MDIEFIEQKSRDDVFRLMEICGVDMAEAYQLYTNANNSFERAMQMHFKQEQSQNKFQQPKSDVNIEEGDDFQTMYQKYKSYRTYGGSFQNNYGIKKSGGAFGFVSSFFSKEPDTSFKKKLQDLLKRPPQLKLSSSSITQTLSKSQKFPVILWVINFQNAPKQKIDELIRSPNALQIFNVQFINVGVDPTQQIQKSLQKVIDIKRLSNSLVILRVNAIQQIDIVTVISLNLTTKQILSKLKLSKSSCINRELDEQHLAQRFYQESIGNFAYKKPISALEKKKIAQDREIRKHQEKQFYESQRAQLQKQRKKSNNDIQSQSKPSSQYTPSQQHAPSSQPQKQQYTPQQQFTPPQQQPQQTKPAKNMTEQRKKIRDRLKEYSSGMAIRLRLPNGESVTLAVSPDEPARYLYDYVLGIDKDIGFERDEQRKFDIVRPYDRLNLSNQQNKKMGVVFEGSESENLVVSEKE